MTEKLVSPEENERTFEAMLRGVHNFSEIQRSKTG